MNKPMSFYAAMKHFFGYKVGQTMADFVAEVKALSDSERDTFKAFLHSVGYTIV